LEFLIQKPLVSTVERIVIVANRQIPQALGGCAEDKNMLASEMFSNRQPALTTADTPLSSTNEIVADPA
jgi:hypothetical protein